MLRLVRDPRQPSLVVVADCDRYRCAVEHLFVGLRVDVQPPAGLESVLIQLALCQLTLFGGCS